MNAPVQSPVLGAAQLAALKDCDPTLRRFPRGWMRAPVTANATAHSAYLVRGLILHDYLESGGAGWVRLTPKGTQAVRQAIGGQP